jgi:hypothetical protein
MRTTARLSLAGCVAIPIFLLSWRPVFAQPPAAKDDAAGMNVLDRGPVHEAFAQPANPDAGPTPVVPKKPPASIPEQPPDQKPPGDNVQWIPGYWAWDSQQRDYVWVSGLWRNAPPGRKWTPGYWNKADDGWQWVPGLWADGAQRNLEYLPEPPQNLDNGPSVPAPNDNSFYVPGCWVYQSLGYRWRPGFWSHAYEGWVWNSPCYMWTPTGYIYQTGYWDYPLADRGLLFAPVYFTRPLWLTPGWVYCPSYVVSAGNFLASLFVRPAWCGYWFGDYYGPNYLAAGFYPWYSYGRRNYDPLFGYYGWAHRYDRGWYSGLQSTYLARRDGLAPRPARGVGSTGIVAAAHGIRSPGLVMPLSQLSRTNRPLTTVPTAQLAIHATAAQRISQASFDRRAAETTAALPNRVASPGPRFSQPPSSFERQSFYAGPGARFSQFPEATSHRAATSEFSRSIPHNTLPYGERSFDHAAMMHAQPSFSAHRPSAPSFAGPRGGGVSHPAAVSHSGGGHSGGHNGAGHSSGGHGHH